MFVFRPRHPEYKTCQKMRDSCEKHQHHGCYHSNYIMTDWKANILPAAFISHKEEEMQSHVIQHNENNKKQWLQWSSSEHLHSSEDTSHHQKRNHNLHHHQTTHDERVEHSQETEHRGWIKAGIKNKLYWEVFMCRMPSSHSHKSKVVTSRSLTRRQLCFYWRWRET